MPGEALRIWPVDKAVRNVKNQGPQLIRPLEPRLLKMLSPAATYVPVSGSRGGAAADRRTAGTPSRLTFRQRNVRGSAEAIARSARGRGRDVSARAIPEAIHNLTVLGSCGAFLQRLGISS